MTMRMFDNRLVWLALALFIAWAVLPPALGEWYRPGTDDYAPTNDCGMNHTLKFVFTDWMGNPCQVTKGTVSDEYAQRIRKQFEGEGDTLTSSLEKALDYIERVIWEIK